MHRTDELVSLGEVKRSALFNERMRPQDFAPGPNLIAYLFEDAPDIPALHLFRHRRRRDFTPAEQRALSLLVPHIRQAITTRFELASVRAERRAFLDVLDRLTLASFSSTYVAGVRGKSCGL